MDSRIIMYQTEDGLTKIETNFDGDTVWLSIDQMADLFQRDKSTISRHIKNIFTDGELERDAVVANFATTAADGKTYQVHGQTAAEIVYLRADAEKEFMGMTSFDGKSLRKADASIAKNYLSEDEIKILNRLVTAYLEFAELQAIRQRPMYMNDWIEKLDDFIKMSGSELLNHAGRISHEKAKIKAELEFQKYKEQSKDELTQVERDFIEHVKTTQKQLEQGKGKNGGR